VVAPDSGGIKSYADESNTYLVSGSAGSFADAVRAAMVSPEVRKSKGEYARSTARRFSWPAVTGSFLELYDLIHAIGAGKVAMEEAVPAFCSTPGDSVRSAATNFLSQTAQAGFKLYSKLAASRSGSRGPAPSLVPPQRTQ
jgi:hypothetical protein